ncbi:MAG: ketoacyl-ACP synthase III [Bacteroidales bacterium]|jgi:3-oxoacyl-[acyl-carrier-protein] synthase-3
MALFSTHNVSIKGISACVPVFEYNNMDYKWIPVKERELNIKTVGVEKRRIAQKGVTTSDLCFHATERLMKDLQLKKEDIELLIFIAQARDYYLPATSIILQDRLGLSKKCMAFDVGLGCSGYVYGLSIAAGLLNSFKLKKALLLVGDVSTHGISYKDKSAFNLFGDAGTATFLEYDENAVPMHFNMNSDGSNFDAIYIPHSGSRRIPDKSSYNIRKFGPGIYRNMAQLALDGVRVFNFATMDVPPNINELLEWQNLTVENIDQFVFHQANLLMNEIIRKKIKIPKEKHPYSIQKFGNTSSASVPLTMITQLRKQLIENKMKFLLAGFGVGLSMGSVILETNKIVCSELVEV